MDHISPSTHSNIMNLMLIISFHLLGFTSGIITGVLPFTEYLQNMSYTLAILVAVKTLFNIKNQDIKQGVKKLYNFLFKW